MSFKKRSVSRTREEDKNVLYSVLRIRIWIHQIHMFLGLLDPDPLIRGMGPDPSIIKIVRKTLISTVL
jgi:hypothetical protein